ncbi:hypothetical protein [Geodermatophilus obscurus]|uniref:hypothetical protein n=1 Tax=Geodermatophilus obscurus TaxID=1861 RepID=UPI0011606FA4|nr:hypothetical protein [Geodermatophilus obscurus]
MEAPDQLGVCVLRVWRYGEAMVVRLHMRADVESPATERVVLVREVEPAVAEIRVFLEQFQHPAEPPELSSP